MHCSTHFSLNTGTKNARGGLSAIAETAIFLMAILLTMMEIGCRSLLFILGKTARLLLQLICTLLLAALCILVCVILTAISLATAGSGMNTTLS